MATSTKKPLKQSNDPGTLVLQWLTYAFWGWTVLALAWLTSASVGFFVNAGSSTGSQSSSIAYSLAAVVVLFLISLLCDVFYSRVEPPRKAGGAMVIMIIHAVLFALCGIGALIAAVFAVVRLLIGDGAGSSYGDEGSVTLLITGFTIAVVYGATLLRTLRLFKFKRSNKIYWLFMTLLTVVITSLAVVGPVAHARETRDDRLIERGLPQLSDTIRAYTKKVDALPATLIDIRSQADGDAQALIDRKLVEYIPGEEVTHDETDAPLGVKPMIAPASDETTYSYKLCVTYKGKNGGQSYPVTPVGTNSISPETYSHEAGRVCYSLQTGYTETYY